MRVETGPITPSMLTIVRWSVPKTLTLELSPVPEQPESPPPGHSPAGPSPAGPSPGMSDVQTTAVRELLRIAPVIDELGARFEAAGEQIALCLLYTSPSPR